MVGGTATPDDIDFIDSANKSIGVFEKDEIEKTIELDSIKFFSGPPKTFKFIIEERANCVIDQDKTTVAVDISRGENIYTIKGV